MMEKNMNVLYFSSDIFVAVAATSMVSLFENNKDFDNITIYLVDDGISEQKKSLLNNLVSSYKRSIVYIEAPEPSEFFKFPFKSRYQMGHSYMRMSIGSILPESVERLLCLDSDTLVLDNLTDLWNIDMEGKILAGVADCVNLKKFKKQFMLSEDDIYCNAGVFLINLKEWQACAVENQIRWTIKKFNGNIFFFEQTLMNYICRKKIVKLTPEYNSFTLFHAMTYRNLMIWRRPTNYYTESEIRKAVEHPRILHFTRNFYMMSRPWVKKCNHPMTTEYFKYKDLTPWKDLIEDNRSWWKKMKYSLIHAIPQRFVVLVASVLYNEIRPLFFWRNE